MWHKLQFTPSLIGDIAAMQGKDVLQSPTSP